MTGTQDPIYDIFTLLEADQIEALRDLRTQSTLVDAGELLRKTWYFNSSGTTKDWLDAVVAEINARVEKLQACKRELATVSTATDHAELKTWFYDSEDGKKLLAGWRAFLDADVDQMLLFSSNTGKAPRTGTAASKIFWSLIKKAGVISLAGGVQGGGDVLNITTFVVGNQGLILQYDKKRAREAEVVCKSGVVSGVLEQDGITFTQSGKPDQDPAAVQAMAKKVAAQLWNQYSMKVC